jgi:hypothetical protein
MTLLSPVLLLCSFTSPTSGLKETIIFKMGYVNLFTIHLLPNRSFIWIQLQAQLTELCSSDENLEKKVWPGAHSFYSAPAAILFRQ